MEFENEYKEKYESWLQGQITLEDFIKIDQEYQKKCFELNKFENMFRSISSYLEF